MNDNVHNINTLINKATKKIKDLQTFYKKNISVINII